MFKKILAIALFVGCLWAVPVSAATPTVSARYTGSGDTVQLTVTGDPNAGVILNYLGAGGIVKMSALGTTNQNGSYSTTISTATYGITTGSLVNISVNNFRSDSMVWPYGTTAVSNNGSLSLGQTSVTVGVGQTSAITVNNTTGNALYLASNTTPGVANVSVSNNQITVVGMAVGTTSLQICSAVNTSVCATLVVVVQSTSVQSGVIFSQTNPSLTPGQVVSITLSGGSGTYALSSNSNNTVIQANVVGNTLTLYGNSNGSSQLTVCAASGSCGTLTAVVAAAGTLPLTLSQSNITLTVGQQQSVALTGAGGYAISNSTNATVANGLITGSMLVVTGAQPGTTAITVCQSGGGCALVTVIVNAASVVAPVPALSLTYQLTVGQEIKMLVSGGSGSYSISSNPGTPFSAILSLAGVLTLRGTAAGTATMSVCSSNGMCTPIAVMVVDAPLVTTPIVSPSIVTPVSSVYRFVAAIVPGDRGTEVTELQKRLKKEGVFTGDVTGFFGAATLEAVKKYQTQHGLNPIGTVGPSTRATLNRE